MTRQALLNEVKKLSRTEQAELLDDLICLVGADEEADVALTPQQAADLKRRMQEADDGKEELVPGDKAFEMLRKRTV